MNPRWLAIVNYRTEKGLVDVTHDLEELSDLDGLVEAGPHFDTVQSIVITRVQHCVGKNLTIEEAEKL